MRAPKTITARLAAHEKRRGNDEAIIVILPERRGRKTAPLLQWGIITPSSYNAANTAKTTPPFNSPATVTIDRLSEENDRLLLWRQAASS